jgi:hypothetical protein
MTCVRILSPSGETLPLLFTLSLCYLQLARCVITFSLVSSFFFHFRSCNLCSVTYYSVLGITYPNIPLYFLTFIVNPRPRALGGSESNAVRGNKYLATRIQNHRTGSNRIIRGRGGTLHAITLVVQLQQRCYLAGDRTVPGNRRMPGSGQCTMTKHSRFASVLFSASRFRRGQGPCCSQSFTRQQSSLYTGARLIYKYT